MAHFLGVLGIGSSASGHDGHVSKQVLSGRLEDRSETDRRSSGELPRAVPLTTDASDPFAAAAERDRRLAALVYASYPLLWRTLRRLGVPEAQIDEALEEVFLVALRRLDGISEDRERSFLLGLALRVASARCGETSQRRERASSSVTDPSAPLPSPESRSEREHARALLDEILGTMGLRARTVFVLFELEGLGVVEIAELLQIPIETVDSRVRHARDSFRRAAAGLERTSPVCGGRP
jgi:RNA polymerase sigma-70 factor, ECF subfamily